VPLLFRSKNFTINDSDINWSLGNNRRMPGRKMLNDQLAEVNYGEVGCGWWSNIVAAWASSAFQRWL
jgi:hypothetical protein